MYLIYDQSTTKILSTGGLQDDGSSTGSTDPHAEEVRGS
jgi:hypothetical protein